MRLQDQGSVIEAYARRLAGVLGVPDFVYEPTKVAKGSTGTREVGDGLLVAGNGGLILQVKSREVGAASTDDYEAAAGWCRKHARGARSQGLGTKRRLSSGGVEVVSRRGYRRILPAIRDWPIVVIVHHPLNPEVDFEATIDTLYLSLHDWLALHTLIRSTHGMIAYVNRALASRITVQLGTESSRYQLLAEADFRWASFSPTSVPVLPGRALDGEDAFAADLFSELIEKVADPTSLGWDSGQYLRIVELIDQVPTLARVTLGRRMIAKFREMVDSQSRRSFFSMDRDSGTNRLCILYDYDHSPKADPSDRAFDALLAAYTTLRHTHAIEAGTDPNGSTLGIGVLHHPQEGRRHSFILIERTPPRLPPDMRVHLERRFGVFDGSSVIDPASQS